MLHIIINPVSASGNAKQNWMSLEQELKTAGVSFVSHLTQGPGDARLLAGQLAAPGSDCGLLAVIGGDGTLNEVACGLPEEGAPPLFYIPSGSGNDFAGGIALPVSMKNAAEYLKKASSLPAHRVDRGCCEAAGLGTFRFFVSSGIGYDAHVCYDLESGSLKKTMNRLHLGFLSFLVVGIKNMFGCPLVSGTVTDHDTGEQFALDHIAFAAAHNLPREGGGFRFAPQASCDDGKLDVVIFTAKNHLRFIWLLLCAAFGGRHIGKKGVLLIRSSKVSIAAASDLCVHTDGEVAGFTQNVCFDSQGAPFTFLF